MALELYNSNKKLVALSQVVSELECRFADLVKDRDRLLRENQSLKLKMASADVHPIPEARTVLDESLFRPDPPYDFGNESCRRTFYRHVNRAVDVLLEITNGNYVKVTQLSAMICQRVCGGVPKNVLQFLGRLPTDSELEVATAVVESIRQFTSLVKNLRGSGRYPRKLRIAQQVLAVATCAAGKVASIPMTQLSEAVGLDIDMLKTATRRLQSISDGEYECVGFSSDTHPTSSS